MIRLYADENVDARLVAALVASGLDVVTAAEFGNARNSPLPIF